MELEAKTPSDSAIETRYILQPNQTNHYGIAFGGVIMSWVDLIAAMVAERHCARNVVTVNISDISFDAPAYVGDHIVLQSSVTYVGNTSLEVGVKVLTENPRTGKVVKTTSAYLTFVALDDDGKPTKVPPLEYETEEERGRADRARIRQENRKELARTLKAQREREHSN